MKFGLLIAISFLVNTFALAQEIQLEKLPSYKSYYLNDTLNIQLIGDSLEYKNGACLECVHIVIDTSFHTEKTLILSINRNGEIVYLKYFKDGALALYYNMTNNPPIYKNKIGYRNKRKKWREHNL